MEELIEGQEPVEEIQEPQVDVETENRAKLMGWIPKEQFKGDPERWRPADQFVKRADELLPIMKTQMKKYEDKIFSLEGEVRTTKGTMEKIVKMADKVSQREYDRAKADILAKQAQAVTDGDTSTWMQLEQEKDRLEKPEPVQVDKPVQEPERPEYREWHEQNDWFQSDPVLTRYANAIAAETPKVGSYADWLRAVETSVKEAFPHKFTNTARQKPSAVDGGDTRGGGAVKPKGNGYNDMPNDARVQCDKYVAQGLFKSREDYVKSYFEEE